MAQPCPHWTFWTTRFSLNGLALKQKTQEHTGCCRPRDSGAHTRHPENSMGSTGRRSCTAVRTMRFTWRKSKNVRNRPLGWGVSKRRRTRGDQGPASRSGFRASAGARAWEGARAAEGDVRATQSGGVTTAPQTAKWQQSCFCGASVSKVNREWKHTRNHVPGVTSGTGTTDLLGPQGTPVAGATPACPYTWGRHLRRALHPRPPCTRLRGDGVVRTMPPPPPKGTLPKSGFFPKKKQQEPTESRLRSFPCHLLRRLRWGALRSKLRAQLIPGRLTSA